MTESTNKILRQIRDGGVTLPSAGESTNDILRQIRDAGIGGSGGDASAVELRVAALENQRGVALGIATLDASAKVPLSQLPAIAVSSVTICDNQAEMLAVTGSVGAVAVRLDVSKTFILAAEPASTLANWQEMLSPTDAVSSVNGRVGVVNLSAADVGAIATADRATAADIAIGTVGKIPDAAQIKSSISAIQEQLDAVKTYTLLLSGL